MKKAKILALICSTLLVIGLAGCGSSKTAPAESAAPAAAQESAAPAAAQESAAPAAAQESAAPAAAQESEAPAAAQESAAPAASTSEVSEAAPQSAEAAAPAGVVTEGAVGFYTDDVDWFARDPYKFAYISNNWFLIHELCEKAFEAWGERMNYEIVAYDSGGDMNDFMAAIESYAGMDYDGLFIDPDPVTAASVIEACEELGIPYMPVVNPLVDNDTRTYLAPAVTLDAYSMGNRQCQWLIDNYKNTWPDVEPEEIGFLFMYVTFNENFVANMEGARDVYSQAYPDLVDSNFFDCDIQGYSFNAEGALDYATTFIAAHPEIKYWWISGCIEDFGQGGTRAAESLGIEDNVLVVTNGANYLIQDWDNGYEGCWKAGTYYAYPVFTEPMAAGLIAVIEGRATYETLWGGDEYIPENQKYPVYPTETRVITKDTYKEYLAEVDAYMNQ